MKIKHEDILDFSKKNIKEIVKGNLKNFELMRKGDMLSIFNFFCMVGGNKKIDVFVTQCPLMLYNRKNIKNNIGIKIITEEEFNEESEITALTGESKIKKKRWGRSYGY